MDEVRFLAHPVTVRSAWLAIGAIVVTTGALAAQDAPKPAKRQRPHRTGLWAEIAAGPGVLRVAHSGDDRIISKSVEGGFLRLGGVISDNVLLAWESAGFNDESFGFGGGDTTVVAEMAFVGVSVLWFPGRTGFFLKGGVGLAQGEFMVPTSATQADTVQGAGIGLTFGPGWDWSFSRKYALTLNLHAFVTAIGDLVLPSGRVDDVIGTVYQLSLSFTFR
jgi:hypothetical protein